MLVYVDLYCTKRHHSGMRCIKIVGGWGSAPDPAGGAYSAPPDPLAGFGGWGRGEGGRVGEEGGRVGEGRKGEGREGKGGDGRGQKERPGTTFFYTLSTDCTDASHSY